MRLPELQGLIRRRILVNYRLDPAILAPILPAPFSPKLHRGYALAGICLIRLEQVRPALTGPVPLGLSSENVAHRIAVRWDDDRGAHEGVYIRRRDTSSCVARLAGGRLFPGEHHRARFDVDDRLGPDEAGSIRIDARSLDGSMHVAITASRAGSLPATSSFASLAEASSFFEAGSLGYSETAEGRHLDGVILETARWAVEPLAVSTVESSWLDDRAVFPRGSIELDCALLMRNIPHRWHGAANLPLEIRERSTSTR